MVKTLLFVSAAIAAFGTAASHKGPVIHIEQGTLQGFHSTSTNGRTFSAFEGIPYAQPPVGKLRFKEPAPPSSWEGLWNATQPGSMCLQYRRTYPTIAHLLESIVGEEDCLFVNVYTPEIPSENSSPNLDVIVYIHGGAFMYGWAHEYQPHHLLDRGIVFVTFNYRLGPLGFLTTEDDVVPGNMGLKDQVAALQWIQKNIAKFGGNPKSVTITGTSAGGASVHYHYLSPLSHGLFLRGYSQSGTALCPWTLMKEGGAKTKQLGAALGCKIKNSKKLVECLRKRPARQIVQQVENFQLWMYTPFSPFGPSVEIGGSNPFLAKSPVDVILDGDVQNIPWIASVATEEGLYPAADWIENEKFMLAYEQHFNEFAPHVFEYNFTVPENKKQEVVDRIREHYIPNKSVSKSATEIIKMIGHRLFSLEVGRAARLQAAVNSAPVYFYEFGYRGENSFSEHMTGTKTDFGVSHGDDTGYTIACFLTTIEDNTKDKDMSNLLLDIWASYAHNGDPIPTGRNFIWTPTTPNSADLEYLHISGPDKLEMRSCKNYGELEFWDSLPIQESQVGKNTPLSSKHHEL